MATEGQLKALEAGGLSPAIAVLLGRAIGAGTVASADAITATNPPAGGTGATAGAYDTAAHRDAMITALTAVIADVTALRTAHENLLTALKAAGIVL